MAALNKESVPAEVSVAARPVRGLLTPALCRKFVRQRIAVRLPAICDGLLKKAELGDLAAVKALLQMAALDKGDSTEADPRSTSKNQLAFVRKMVAEFSHRS